MKNHLITVICLLVFACHTTMPIKQVSPVFAAGAVAGTLLTVGAYGFIYRQKYSAAPKKNSTQKTSTASKHASASPQNPLETPEAINELITNLNDARNFVASTIQQLSLQNAPCMIVEHDPHHTNDDVLPTPPTEWFRIRIQRTYYECKLQKPVQNNPVIDLKNPKDKRDPILQIKYNAFLALKAVAEKFKGRSERSQACFATDSNDDLIRYIDGQIQQEKGKLLQATAPINNQNTTSQQPAPAYRTRTLIAIGCAPLAYWALYCGALARYNTP